MHDQSCLFLKASRWAGLQVVACGAHSLLFYVLQGARLELAALPRTRDRVQHLPRLARVLAAEVLSLLQLLPYGEHVSCAVLCQAATH